jgi:hypothetical protein
MRTFIVWLSYTTLALTVAFLLVFAFFQLYPFDIQKRENPYMAVTNENSRVHPGELLKLKDEYCKLMPYDATVSRSFIDGIEYPLPVYQSNRDVGCYNGTENVEIPNTLQAGIYQYRIVFVYHLPFGREVIESATSEPFYIVK